MKTLVYGAGVLGCNLARNLFRALHGGVDGEEQRQHRQRTGNVGSHLRQKVGKCGFNGIHPLHDMFL